MNLRAAQNSFYSSLSMITKNFRLRIQSGHCGFFGDFFMALNGLMFCDNINIEGWPDWGKKSLYYDATQGENAWDYFFEKQTPNPDGLKSKPLLALPYWPEPAAILGNSTMNPRSVAQTFIRKYGTPKKEIQEMADSFIKTSFSGASSVIGVHIRGTDATTGVEERKCSGIEEYMRELDLALTAYPASLIFLATDEIAIVDTFKQQYGEKIVTQDCIRSTDGNSVHGHYDGGVEGSHYQKGVEVVKDALLLARCNFLIRGHSRVTCYSLCYNPTLKFIDVDKKYYGIDRTPWLHA